MRGGKLRVRALILIVASMTVAAAGCGSSSKAARPATSPTTLSNSGTATSSPGAPTPAEPGSNPGASPATFCNLVRNDVAAFNPFRDLATMKPTDLKSLYSRLRPALAQTQTVAPSEIRSDVATFVTFFQQLDSALAGAQYDVANLDLTSVADLNTAKVRTASADISRYVTQKCHVGGPASPAT
jgi:hypothetical protein